MRVKIRGNIPGRNAKILLDSLKRKNGGWDEPLPIAFSGKGEGAYCEDLDKNIFLDFASQVASNPLGYNHPEMVKKVEKYSRRFPIKYAGQDFLIKEHSELIDELLSISPSGMNSAFLINSGAEAVENATKIAMRGREGSKFGVSMSGGFHGRTLGALSWTHSKPINNKGYWSLPNLILPYEDDAGEDFERIVEKKGADKIGFLIVEHVQGEGGYKIASKKMVLGLNRICRKYKIPYISDEVQAGMGRTGKWWAFENYGIRPEIFSSAKALQVGAVVSSKKIFPKEIGAISSTWGGGHIVDIALGLETIRIIKKEKLLERNRKNGEYLLNGLKEIEGVENARGLGLMSAVDFSDSRLRDKIVLQCAKNGLIVLGCGQKSIRFIPPYIIGKEEIDEGLEILQKSIREVKLMR